MRGRWPQALVAGLMAPWLTLGVVRAQQAPACEDCDSIAPTVSAVIASMDSSVALPPFEGTSEELRLHWDRGRSATDALVVVRRSGQAVQGAVYMDWPRTDFADAMEAAVRRHYRVDSVSFGRRDAVARLSVAGDVDWSDVWQSLVLARALELPCGATLHGENMTFDDDLLFVEVLGPASRRYRYFDPRRQTMPEARDPRSILELIEWLRTGCRYGN